MQRIRKQSYPATLYSVLDVCPGCTAQQLSAAFKAKAVLYHPDTQGGGDAELYKQLSENYSILKQQHLRDRYDAQLKLQGNQCSGCQGLGWLWKAATHWGELKPVQEECPQCEGTGQQATATKQGIAGAGRAGHKV